jgi:GNAT superfamily N-acetyltransferase
MPNFKRLVAPTEQELQQIRSIYEPNFPASERKPFEMLVQGVTDQKYHLLTLQDHRGIVGIAFLMPLTDVSMMFLEYIAIDKTLQNQGLGSKLFQNIAQYYLKMGKITAIIWEIEPPKLDDPSAMANRRISWYKRLGAGLIPMTDVYAMPSYAPEYPDPVSLQLMWIRIGSSIVPIKVEDIASIVSNIYQVAYPNNMALSAQIVKKLHESYSN